MVNSRSQSTDYDDKLPIEYSPREALSIYFKRLKIFFAVVILNILLFLFFIAAQRLSVQFAYLLSMNMAAFSFFLIIIFLIPTLSFVYMRSNPVKGYLTFSDENISPINLYSGWRITKKHLYLLDSERGKVDIFLVAKYISSYREGSIFGKRLQIRIQLRDKSRHIIYEKDIVENSTVSLPNGTLVSYQRQTG